MPSNTVTLPTMANVKAPAKIGRRMPLFQLEPALRRAGRAKAHAASLWGGLPKEGHGSRDGYPLAIPRHMADQRHHPPRRCQANESTVSPARLKTWPRMVSSSLWKIGEVYQERRGKAASVSGPIRDKARLLSGCRRRVALRA
jgi:hypothetical protein